MYMYNTQQHMEHQVLSLLRALLAAGTKLSPTLGFCTDEGRLPAIAFWTQAIKPFCRASEWKIPEGIDCSSQPCIDRKSQKRTHARTHAHTHTRAHTHTHTFFQFSIQHTHKHTTLRAHVFPPGVAEMRLIIHYQPFLVDLYPSYTCLDTPMCDVTSGRSSLNLETLPNSQVHIMFLDRSGWSCLA